MVFLFSLRSSEPLPFLSVPCHAPPPPPPLIIININNKQHLMKVVMMNALMHSYILFKCCGAIPNISNVSSSLMHTVCCYTRLKPYHESFPRSFSFFLLQLKISSIHHHLIIKYHHHPQSQHTFMYIFFSSH